jgi:HK97 family phage prohead protease
VQHLAVKAASTITERGEFTAIAATYSLDRQNERIEPGAFARTIAAWQDRGGQLPLHWNHSAAAEDVIGSVDPGTMREEPNVGLHVRGQLDLENSEVAREAWRSMKQNIVGLSFGYLTTASHMDGEVKVIDEVDLFEVTITPAPANADTRILSTKAASRSSVSAGFYAAELPPSVAELRADLEEATKGIDLRPAPRIVSFKC